MSILCLCNLLQCLAKVARLLLNSQKKVEQRMREAYAQEEVVEEAAYLEPDDYDNFE